MDRWLVGWSACCRPVGRVIIQLVNMLLNDGRAVSLLRASHTPHRRGHAAENRDVSAGPLDRPLARTPVPLTHSLARSLTYPLPSSWYFVRIDVSF